MESDIGDLTQLITTNKSNLVSATNELATNFNNFFGSGTWTPVLACVGSEQAPTYTTSIINGKYRKVGDLVYIEFYIRGKITALNGTNNYIFISGLPYANATLSQGQQAFSLGIEYGLIASGSELALNVYNSGIRLQTGNGSGAAKYKVTSTSYFEIGGSGFYIAQS